MANLHNKTPGKVELVPLIDRHGANVVAVISKVTYEVRDGWLDIADDQQPVTFADVVVSPEGEELAEASDITDFKPSTDVIVTRPAAPLTVQTGSGREVSVEVGPVRFGGTMKSPWPFGPVPRSRAPRKGYAGTYGRAWLDERFPMLPIDFDPRHNQAAPTSQIAPRPLMGDEKMTIRNLYANGQVLHAALPGRTVVVAGNIRGRYFTEIADLDTVTLSGDRPLVRLVWRVALRPRQKIEEVRNVFVSMAQLRSTREIYGRP